MMHKLSMNKKAKYNYELLDSYVAGISLEGWEVKVIKNGEANIESAYITIDDKGSAWLKNMNVPSYKNSSNVDMDNERDRRLLLNKSELKKLKHLQQAERVQLIPYKLLANNKGKIKLEFYTAKSKKQHDKRETEKKKTQERQARLER